MLNPLIPLWFQIAQGLRAEVASSGDAGPVRLQTETELAARFGVSLVTVRQALKFLQSTAFVSRHRRLGTFAHPPAAIPEIKQLVGASQPVMIQRLWEDTVVLSRGRVSTPGRLSVHFPSESELYEFERLHMDKGEAIAFTTNHVLLDLGAQIDEQAARSPITQVLKDKLKVPIHRIQQTVGASLPTPKVAQLLQIDVMTPILHFTGLTYGASERVIDTAQMFCRADRVQFTFNFDFAGPPAKAK